MHNQNIDLNLFKVLDAIYSEGNLTRAAERLNLTQPAVSHALARLRESFNDALFTRQKNRMVPTQVTRKVISDVRESLHILQASVQNASSFNASTSQKGFVVSLRDILESTCLPPMMKLIEKRAPGITITSAKLDRHDMESKLASGDIDLAIDVLLPVTENFCHQLLTKDRPVVVVRNGHPEINDTLTVEAYLNQRHILVSSRTSGLGREDFELSRWGLQRTIGLRCQHYYSACRVVQETNMLLTMPETYAKILISSIPATLHPLPVEIPELDVHLYWHKNSQSDHANIWLRETLMASIR